MLAHVTHALETIQYVETVVKDDPELSADASLVANVRQCQSALKFLELYIKAQVPARKWGDAMSNVSEQKVQQVTKMVNDLSDRIDRDKKNGADH